MLAGTLIGLLVIAGIAMCLADTGILRRTVNRRHSFTLIVSVRSNIADTNELLYARRNASAYSPH